MKPAVGFARHLGQGLERRDPTVRIAGPILLTNPFYELPEVARNRTPQVDSVAAKFERLALAST